jgi:hypothetical protein
MQILKNKILFQMKHRNIRIFEGYTFSFINFPKFTFARKGGVQKSDAQESDKKSTDDVKKKTEKIPVSDIPSDEKNTDEDNINFSFKGNKKSRKKNDPKNIISSQKQNEDDVDNKTIKVIKEEVPLRISPYFSDVVQKEKIFFAEAEKDKTKEIKEEKEKLLKAKNKINAARHQQAAGRKLKIVIDSIKRELPNE